MARSKQGHVRFPPHIIALLDELYEETGINRSEVVRMGVVLVAQMLLKRLQTTPLVTEKE